MAASMKKISIKNTLLQACFYLFGFVFIAVGINFSKMSSLGISPVSSIPYACENIWGFTLGTTTNIIYAILIVLQLVFLLLSLLKKRKKTGKTDKSDIIPFIKAVLGFAVTYLFAFIINLTGINEKAFGHLLLNFPRPENYFMRLLYTVAAVILIAIGVFMYLRPHWIPLPAEGLAGALAGFFGKSFGDCKTVVDCSMIAIALILQLIFLGGFSSFSSEQVVVREGTIIAAVAVGQIVKPLTKLWGAKIDKFIGTKKD